MTLKGMLKLVANTGSGSTKGTESGAQVTKGRGWGKKPIVVRRKAKDIPVQ
ncbi:zinc finger CCCH domain-containing protein 4 [Sesbania bispinosa]|nr:zinc finger CCCH domain-containing protein 4 [Sesbania bispinosa]